MIWNFPNILTVMRLVAAPGIVVMFLYFSRPMADWLALALFLIAAISDWFDGYLARDPPELDELLMSIDPSLIKFVLRDAALVAAVDGAYDAAEMKMIRQLAAAAEVEDDTLKEIFDWVNSGLEWHHQSLNILGL